MKSESVDILGMRKRDEPLARIQSFWRKTCHVVHLVCLMNFIYDESFAHFTSTVSGSLASNVKPFHLNSFIYPDCGKDPHSHCLL